MHRMSLCLHRCYAVVQTCHNRLLPCLSWPSSDCLLIHSQPACSHAQMCAACLHADMLVRLLAQTALPACCLQVAAAKEEEAGKGVESRGPVSFFNGKEEKDYQGRSALCVHASSHEACPMRPMHCPSCTSRVHFLWQVLTVQSALGYTGLSRPSVLPSLISAAICSLLV